MFFSKLFLQLLIFEKTEGKEIADDRIEDLLFSLLFSRQLNNKKKIYIEKAGEIVKKPPPFCMM